MKQEREYWLDNVKGFACVLVALGHLLQGVHSANVIPSICIYEWFEQTIYYFHVPLFFICSGYLYQKCSVVNTLSAWKDNVCKKLVNLGVPYFVFSLATWVLKNAFSGSVNSETNGLVQDLFIVPQSPYWYLYGLFFIFLITPTFSDKRACTIALMAAMGLKVIHMAVGGVEIYAVNVIMDKSIWFVIGMTLCTFDVPTHLRKWKWMPHLGIALLASFVLGSVATTWFSIEEAALSFGMGLLACAAVLMLFWIDIKQSKWVYKATAYTMPVFLMHTIFAAGLRSVLLKAGITNGIVHIVAGIIISFAGPVVMTEIMKRLKLDILIYPGKYIKPTKKKGEECLKN